MLNHTITQNLFNPRLPTLRPTTQLPTITARAPSLRFGIWRWKWGQTQKHTHTKPTQSPKVSQSGEKPSEVEKKKKCSSSGKPPLSPPPPRPPETPAGGPRPTNPSRRGHVGAAAGDKEQPARPCAPNRPPMGSTAERRPSARPGPPAPLPPPRPGPTPESFPSQFGNRAPGTKRAGGPPPLGLGGNPSAEPLPFPGPGLPGQVLPSPSRPFSAGPAVAPHRAAGSPGAASSAGPQPVPPAAASCAPRRHRLRCHPRFSSSSSSLAAAAASGSCRGRSRSRRRPDPRGGACALRAARRAGASRRPGRGRGTWRAREGAARSARGWRERPTFCGRDRGGHVPGRNPPRGVGTWDAAALAGSARPSPGAETSGGEDAPSPGHPSGSRRPGSVPELARPWTCADRMLC